MKLGPHAQVIALPHGEPVAIVDLRHADLRLALDQYSRVLRMSRDDTAQQLVIDRLAELGYPKPLENNG